MLIGILPRYETNKLSSKSTKPSSKDKLYSISELAEETNVTVRTIRFYESLGLIMPQRVGANRIYTYKDHVRLQLILRFKSAGLKLEQTKEFLSLYDSDEQHIAQLKMGFTGLCEIITQLDEQIAKLDTRRQVLNSLRDEAESMLLDRGVDIQKVLNASSD